MSAAFPKHNFPFYFITAPRQNREQILPRRRSRIFTARHLCYNKEKNEGESGKMEKYDPASAAFFEPVCPLAMDAGQPDVRPIPLRRVMARLDEHLARDDYDGAQRHLDYWLDEALRGGDRRGAFALYNEQMGLGRKTGRREAALKAMDRALALAGELGYEETAAGGTCFVNAATVCTAFGEPERALALFSRAQAAYGRTLGKADERLGGLYNNMALALVELRRFDEAFECYEKALAVMEQAENGEPEQAVTWLNMANAAEDSLGIEAAIEQIEEYVHKAMTLLDTPGLPRDGNYAFVCEKCAPTFDYYGQFVYAAALRERAKSIHEGS